jgi:hypothetical protein
VQEVDGIQVDVFPQLRAFSRSEDSGERAVFMRVYFDLFEARRARGEAMPESWTAALRACLSAADDAGAPASVDPADHDDVEATLRRGGLDALIGLADDRTARLKSDQIEALVARARALAEAGDIRLARALLARGPVRLQHAPLFLEADAEQRLSVLLAVQRAELGRKSGPSRELDPALAEPLEFAAIAGRRAEFANALALALGVSPALAARIGADPGGEALVVALAALGAPRDLGVRILTARDMSESAGAFPRLHALARLAGQLSAPAARRLIGALAGAVAAPAPSLAGANPREAETPSPFVRREPAAGRAVSPETSLQPRNVRTVGAK